MRSKPCEGIYYVIRCPTGWEAVFYHFDVNGDYNHYDWWEESLSAQVAAKWVKALRKSAETIRQDIRLLTYAFPRGRISKVGRRFLSLHGADLTKPMNVSKKIIEDAFGLSERVSWQIDEHEQCQSDDKEQMRRILRIPEDWNAVS